MSFKSQNKKNRRKCLLTVFKLSQMATLIINHCQNFTRRSFDKVSFRPLKDLNQNLIYCKTMFLVPKT